jgi:Zn finger protein HypA/HybF involved in hydrogenase expression
MRNFIIRERGEKCEECGIEDWNGNPLSFHIDHINGNRTDNRYDNLKVLCPNCHSQTETFGFKNASEEGKLRMIESANTSRALRNTKN